MNKFPSLSMAAAAIGALVGMPNATIAAPITYDFTGTVSGNQALTGSHTYTAIGGPNLTAISGSYTHSGSGMPAAGDAFTVGGQLVGNNRGADEMGVGVCFGNGCNNGHIDDNPEIDASGREVVRLDISGLFSAYGSFTINADSATDGEVLGIFASNAPGTALGAKLADATSASGNAAITPTSQLSLLRRRQHHHKRCGCASAYAHRHAQCGAGAGEPRSVVHRAFWRWPAAEAVVRTGLGRLKSSPARNLESRRLLA